MRIRIRKMIRRKIKSRIRMRSEVLWLRGLFPRASTSNPHTAPRYNSAQCGVWSDAAGCAARHGRRYSARRGNRPARQSAISRPRPTSLVRRRLRTNRLVFRAHRGPLVDTEDWPLSWRLGRTTMGRIAVFRRRPDCGVADANGHSGLGHLERPQHSRPATTGKCESCSFRHLSERNGGIKTNGSQGLKVSFIAHPAGGYDGVLCFFLQIPVGFAVRAVQHAVAVDVDMWPG